PPPSSRSTLSLHDALPICSPRPAWAGDVDAVSGGVPVAGGVPGAHRGGGGGDGWFEGVVDAWRRHAGGGMGGSAAADCGRTRCRSEEHTSALQSREKLVCR